LFKLRVRLLERRCRITGVDRIELRRDRERVFLEARVGR
jgi:hypothetical protein